jgi:hypothetical protein
MGGWKSAREGLADSVNYPRRVLALSLRTHQESAHALGTPQSEDRLLHADPEQPHVPHLIDRTDDGRNLIIYSTPGPGLNDLSVIDLTSADWACRELFAGFEAEWSVIGSKGNLLFVLTSQNAERRRIVTLHLAQPEPWRTHPRHLSGRRQSGSLSKAGENLCFLNGAASEDRSANFPIPGVMMVNEKS